MNQIKSVIGVVLVVLSVSGRAQASPGDFRPVHAAFFEADAAARKAVFDYYSARRRFDWFQVDARQGKYRTGEWSDFHVRFRYGSSGSAVTECSAWLQAVRDPATGAWSVPEQLAPENGEACM